MKDFVTLTKDAIQASGFQNGNPLLPKRIQTLIDSVQVVSDDTIALETHGMTITLTDSIGDVVIDYRGITIVCDYPWKKVLGQARALAQPAHTSSKKRKPKRAASETMEEPHDPDTIKF